MPSFKVPCPSCETQVLIKSEKQIGTKTECPKCKYRFKVEAPGGAAGDDEAAKPAGKKKNKKMLIGIGVGVVAVAVLGIVGAMVLGGGKPDKPKGGGFVNKGVTPPVTPPGGDNKGDEGKKPDDKKDKKAPEEIPGSKVEATNLLPPNTTAVIRLNPTRMRESPLFFPLFEDRMAQVAAQYLGFDPNDVHAYYHAGVGTDRQPFGVVRLKKAMTPAAVVGGLRADPTKRQVRLADRSTKDYYLIPANPLFDAIGRTFTYKNLLGDLYKPTEAAKGAVPAAAPLAAHVYDTQTVLIAEQPLMETFLKSLQKNGFPAFQSDTASNNTYRTIPRELKILLNGLYDREGDDAPPLVVAEVFDVKRYDLDRLKSPYDEAAGVVKPVARQITHAGVRLALLSPRQLAGTVRLLTAGPSAAAEVAEKNLQPALQLGVPLLSPLLGTPVEYRRAGAAGAAAEGGQPGPAGPGQPPGPPGPGVRPRPMGEGPGPGGPGPAGPMGEQPPAAPQSFVELDLRSADSLVILNLNLHWTDAAYKKTIEPRLSAAANQVRGQLVVYAGNAAWQVLAKAGPEAAKSSLAKNMFPVGAYPRPGGAGRLGLAHRPAYRASFFADLLPYLGHDQLYRNLRKDLAWFDDTGKGAGGMSNLQVAESWVPELLVPYYPASSWRATSPFAPGRVLGGTNFVGVAGIGRDAALFDPKDPQYPDAEYGWRRGMTGYDWGSKPEEVKDGLANTIYLLQTPPKYSRPWLAGGGATVVGLDRANPMADFAYDQPDGKGGTKKGTYALMGDMSVRWIPADIDPKVFLSLSTRAGGAREQKELMLDKVDLDAVAPKVEPWRKDGPVAKTPDPTLTPDLDKGKEKDKKEPEKKEKQ